MIRATGNTPAMETDVTTTTVEVFSTKSFVRKTAQIPFRSECRETNIAAFCYAKVN
jgi:hypothetical protein